MAVRSAGPCPAVSFMLPCVPPHQKISGSKFSFTVGTFAFFVSAFSSEPSPSESSSAACIVAVFTRFFLPFCFPAHLEHLISVSVIGCGEEALAAFGNASESVFSVVGVDGGFSFCLFFDQVSVIVVDILDLIACLGVFLCDYLVSIIINISIVDFG